MSDGTVRNPLRDDAVRQQVIDAVASGRAGRPRSAVEAALAEALHSRGLPPPPPEWLAAVTDALTRGRRYVVSGRSEADAGALSAGHLPSSAADAEAAAVAQYVAARDAALHPPARAAVAPTEPGPLPASAAAAAAAPAGPAPLDPTAAARPRPAVLAGVGVAAFVVGALLDRWLSGRRSRPEPGPPPARRSAA